MTLHGVRLLGFAATQQTASRFGLDRGEVEENLLDFEAYGWVSWSEFAGSAGWSVTDRGRAENERRLAAELDASGARSTVVEVHSRFLPLGKPEHHQTAAARCSRRYDAAWKRRVTRHTRALDAIVCRSVVG